MNAADPAGGPGPERGVAPWWLEPLPPVEGNPPDAADPVPVGLWGGTALGTGPALQPYPRSGGTPRTVSRRLLVVGIVTAVLASAGVSALVAWAVGSATGESQNSAATRSALDPNARLSVSEPQVVGSPQPGSVRAIASAILPSVVTIRVRAGSDRGTGAGVIVRSDGYILTNNHVVAPAGQTGTVTVDVNATTTGVAARIVGRSPVDDLAVIKIERTGLQAARLGRSDALAVGDLVVAVGAPLGLSGTVTSGIVSALSRTIDVPGEDGAVVLGNAIQTDAAINPGNSGGALVDASGAVVGINAAIASTAQSEDVQSGSIGVGFAIPIDYARSVAEELIRTGKATHPYLGVVPVTIDADNPVPGGPSAGAFVRRVLPGTPAAGAGLRGGDVITRLGKAAVTSADDLVAATRLYAIGERVTVVYVRAGATRSVELVLAEAPSS